MKAQNGMKECSRCRQVKPVSAFGKCKSFCDGLNVYCKECLIIERKLPHKKAAQKAANERHRKTEGYKERMPSHGKRYRSSEKGKANTKKYIAEHKDEWKSYHKEYAQVWAKTPEGQASLKKARMKLYYKNLEVSRAKQREGYQKRKQSIEYRVNDAVSSNVYCALKKRKNGRSWEQFVGYTLSDLMQHIEKQFVDGMSWDNYGQWHIDHIKPRYTFTIDQIKECWMLSNLRPLWAEDNLKRPKPRLTLPL